MSDRCGLPDFEVAFRRGQGLIPDDDQVQTA